MPIQVQGKTFLNSQELQSLFGKSKRSVARQIAKQKRVGKPVATEMVSERHSTGGARVAYYDPFGLDWPIPKSSQCQFFSGTDRGQLVPPVSATLGSQCQVEESTLHTAFSAEGGDMSVRQLMPRPVASTDSRDAGIDLVQELLTPSEQIIRGDTNPELLERHRDVLTVSRHPKYTNARAAALQELARKWKVSPSSAYREVKAFEEKGLDGLKTHRRSDAGVYRISPEALQVIVGALVSNPPTASASFLHRTLLRAVPHIMKRERGGKEKVITVQTIRKIRRDMEQHPMLRLMFYDETRRKEYIRSYSGQVAALHANQMWQLDMTRCDVEVVDPETGRIYRPRVQAVIDVYSGCIVGICFSESEDQAQADLALMRALTRKAGRWEDVYPVYGLPHRLYIDNGKTYSSEQFHRVANELGIEVIHSLPRVSHTRGKVERFFGTLHQLERSMTGYVGENAVNRSADQLKKLRKSTERWLETGNDPGPFERFQTITEYQNAVLAWLVGDYHSTVVDGLTRLEHFQQTAPAATLVEFDQTELLLLFAHRVTRVVRPDGTVSVDGVSWTIPDGKLAQYRGLKVLVLEDQFSLGEYRGIAWKSQRTKKLEMLGVAIPAPTIAASVEAGEYRRAQKAAKKSALAEADALMAEYRNPNLMVTRQLVKDLPTQDIQPLPPKVRARLQPEPPPPDDIGDFGKSILQPADDFEALLASLGDDE